MSGADRVELIGLALVSPQRASRFGAATTRQPPSVKTKRSVTLYEFAPSMAVSTLVASP